MQSRLSPVLVQIWSVFVYFWPRFSPVLIQFKTRLGPDFGVNSVQIKSSFDLVLSPEFGPVEIKFSFGPVLVQNLVQF